jgi:drug/metabolite transporter (DMT)-like permease
MAGNNHIFSNRLPASMRSTFKLGGSSVGMVLLSVVLAAVGQLVFKLALKEIGVLTLSPELLVKMISSPALLLGLVIFVASAGLWLVALMRADLSFAYPFLSLSYVIVLMGGVVLFGEKLTLPRLLGFGLIVAGLLIVATSRTTTNHHSPIDA